MENKKSINLLPMLVVVLFLFGMALGFILRQPKETSQINAKFVADGNITSYKQGITEASQDFQKRLQQAIEDLNTNGKTNLGNVVVVPADSCK